MSSHFPLVSGQPSGQSACKTGEGGGKNGMPYISFKFLYCFFKNIFALDFGRFQHSNTERKGGGGGQIYVNYSSY